MKIPKLEELIISKRFELHGNNLFFVQNNCLYSIDLPKKINEMEQKIKQVLEPMQF